MSNFVEPEACGKSTVFSRLLSIGSQLAKVSANNALSVRAIEDGNATYRVVGVLLEPATGKMYLMLMDEKDPDITLRVEFAENGEARWRTVGLTVN
jgi:hypothetical protein